MTLTQADARASGRRAAHASSRPSYVAGHAQLVEELDERLREIVRREGVDPQRDADVVRRIAESMVREHDERSLTGAVAPVADVDAVVGELVARVSGFGPLQPFLDDPAVQEVWINEPTAVRSNVLAWAPARVTTAWKRTRSPTSRLSRQPPPLVRLRVATLSTPPAKPPTATQSRGPSYQAQDFGRNKLGGWPPGPREDSATDL